MIPMIDWRRLDLARDGARTELDLAALALRDALHKALADVEAQFAEQTRLQRTGAVLDAHARETRQAEQNALVRYDAGAIGRLDWLQARNATLASELDRINQRLKAWQNLVTLHKALGGPV
jgi:outer membrane protein TolC